LYGDLKTVKQKNSDQRKELIKRYKEMKTEAGIYQIKNIKNSKIYVTSTPNFKTMNGARMILNSGTYKSRALQEDWNKFGEDSFVFEILEVLKEKEEGFFDKKFELKELEKKWLNKLQPYNNIGYN
jgi:group I intron endonuclease